jgi:hypothetical protein
MLRRYLNQIQAVLLLILNFRKSKTAENSLSFELDNVCYFKKIALRSGIRLSLGYNTNNVVYTTGLVNNNLTNIRYSSKALIEIKNAASLTSLTPLKRTYKKHWVLSIKKWDIMKSH